MGVMDSGNGGGHGDSRRKRKGRTSYRLETKRHDGRLQMGTASQKAENQMQGESSQIRTLSKKG